MHSLKNSSRQKLVSRWRKRVAVQGVLVLFSIRSYFIWPPAHDTISFHTYFSHFYVLCVRERETDIYARSTPKRTNSLEINQAASETSQQINTTMEYFNLLQITLFLFLRCALILFSAFLRW